VGQPAAWHGRAKAAKPLRRSSRVVRDAGKATYPKLTDSTPEQVSGSAGTVDVPVPEGVEGDLLVRASADNALRQRSDPRQTPVE
jgi:hypothetical protein